MEIEKYYNSDKTAIAVLVSPGYGAGWSTWNCPEIAYDRRVVEYWSEFWLDRGLPETYGSINRMVSHIMSHGGDKEVENFMEFIGYYNVYCGGWEDIGVEWVPVGSLFRIEEYDGSECLEIFNENSYTRA